MPAPSSSSHHERLTVSPGIWLLALAFGASLVVAVGLYTNAWIGTSTALVYLLVSVSVLGGWGAVRVGADEAGIQAGRAHIEWRWVAGVEALDAAGLRRVMGPGAKATALLVLRPYVPAAVRITLDDPADPHPYWVVSTRHPDRFAAVAAEHLHTPEDLHAGEARP